MTIPKVLVTRRIAQEALDMVTRIAATEIWPHDFPIPYEILLEKIGDVDGILTMVTDRIDSTLIEAGSRLKVISTYAVGYDNIDIREATRRGIVVGNTPEVLTETTADLAFALFVSAARRVTEADNYTRAEKWKTWGPEILLGQDIHLATLGIIGLGHIGTAVARRARGFNMKVLYYDKIRQTEKERHLEVEYVPELARLISVADFISVHLPLLPDTRHLIGVEEFAMMKPTAVFVNTSRGPIVDQKALYQALKSNQIFAAGTDVTEIEPIPYDDPLLELDNIIITPHIGSASFITRKKMALMAAENLLAGLRGELPLNCVNPEAFRS